MTSRARVDIERIKAAAPGRWPEILSAVGGVDRAILDGRNHPCPKCGGTDRFRLIDAAAGALFCNQCFSSGNGDGLAAVRWLRECDFPTALRLVASHLGIDLAAGDGRPKVAKTYNYRDETGKLLYQVCRFEPKDFRQRAPVEGGGWTWSTKGVRKVLFRLPELLTADAGETVFVCEGEKDADRLAGLGLVATCNVGGAGKWRPEYSETLWGRRVAILPDNDEAGRDHAAKVARSLHGVAASVRVVALAGLPEKGDVSNWLDNGGTIQELGRLVEKTPEWTPPPPPRSAAAAGPVEPEGEQFPFTDSGNAERLVHLFGAGVHYCHPWGKWLVWDGRRWALDAAGEAQQLAKRTARAILGAAADVESKAVRDSMVCHARRSESAGGRAAMLRCTESEPGIPVQPNELDRDAWLLNVENGTIDLRSGKLRSHDKKDLITKIAPVVFDPAATCPTWERFMAEIFGGDAELVGFVQRFLGYCLTGDVSEQVLAIWHGAGANGKSTAINAVLDVLGEDYCLKAASDLLLAKRGNEHPTALTDLHGKRLAACIETDEGRRMAEGMVKEMTGGDPIRARRMREDYWQFLPTHKIILACNHRPTIRGTDHAVWRRIRLVPFNIVVPLDRRDKGLPEKLRGERVGILAWLLRGCLDWQRIGLGEPAAVSTATSEYQDSEDALGQFLYECCELAAAARVRASDLLDAYRQWSGDGRLSVRKLTKLLTERGIERYTNNGVWYRGVGLPANGTTEQLNEFSY